MLTKLTDNNPFWLGVSNWQFIINNRWFLYLTCWKHDDEPMKNNETFQRAKFFCIHPCWRLEDNRFLQIIHKHIICGSLFHWASWASSLFWLHIILVNLINKRILFNSLSQILDFSFTRHINLFSWLVENMPLN